MTQLPDWGACVAYDDVGGIRCLQLKFECFKTNKNPSLIIMHFLSSNQAWILIGLCEQLSGKSAWLAYSRTCVQFLRLKMKVNKLLIHVRRAFLSAVVNTHMWINWGVLLSLEKPFEKYSCEEMMEDSQRNLFEVWKKITKYVIWKGVAN